MIEHEKSLPQLVDTKYLHISNGGIAISIWDDPKLGPTIKIDSSQFGNNAITQVIHTDHASICELSDMFERAKTYIFHTKPYCHAAIANRKTIIGDCSSDVSA